MRNSGRLGMCHHGVISRNFSKKRAFEGNDWGRGSNGMRHIDAPRVRVALTSVRSSTIARIVERIGPDPVRPPGRGCKYAHVSLG